MPLCAGGSLQQDLENRQKQNKAFTTQELLRAARDLCSGLKVLHQLGLVHTDIKPGNILLDQEGTLMLADFGVTVISSRDNGPMRSKRSHYYRTAHVPPPSWGFDPNNFTLDQGFKVDGWAAGKVLLEMANLCPVCPATPDLKRRELCQLFNELHASSVSTQISVEEMSRKLQ